MASRSGSRPLLLVAFYLAAVLAAAHRCRSLALPSIRPRSDSSRPTTATALRAASAAAANEGRVEVSRSRSSSSDGDGDGDGSSSVQQYYGLSYRIARPMSLSSRTAAPIVVLHGGPSLPSSYLYPLEDVVPYRSIVYHDQLGCGGSDAPEDVSLYSIEDSVRDLRMLLRKLGVRRFHLYGQSYGGILAFEYMKSAASSRAAAGEDGDEDPECLSAILSSAPTDIPELEAEFDRLSREILSRHDGENLTGEEELDELFRREHQCRLPEMPASLSDAYANVGTVWGGIAAIADYVARPPPEGAARMPSALVMRGEFDFVSEASVGRWRDAFNTKFLRYKTLEGCSHHGLHENGELYGEIVDSYFAEYD